MQQQNRKIAACIIVKNDSEVGKLRTCLESVAQYVDKVFVTANNTPNKEIQKLVKGFRGDYSFTPWTDSFADVRNFNFKRAYEAGYEYIFWLDTDDTLIGGKNLRKLADEMPDHMDMYVATYDYGKDNGYTNLDHGRERLIRFDPTRMKWVGRVHEQLITNPSQAFAKTEDILLDHSPKTESDIINTQKRNLRLLQIELDEQGDKPDPRTLIQLGRTHLGLGEYKEAMKYLEQYIPLSGWDEERYEAFCMMAYMLELQGNIELAEAIYHRAIIEKWDRYPAYEGLIRIMASKSNWSGIVHWYRTLVSIPKPRTFHMNSDMSVRLTSRGYYAMALILLGHLEKGWQEWSELKEEYGNHPMIKEFDGDITKSYSEGKAIKSLSEIVKFMVAYDKSSLKGLFESLPRTLKHNRLIASMKQQALDPVTHPKDSVVIYCGDIGFEEWAYPSIIKGIGGSEEAVINISQELTKLGYKVTVYNKCGILAGEYGGVTYLPHYECNPNDNFNIFISWRDPMPLTMVKAKIKWCWMHDVPSQDQFPEFVLKDIDKIMVLSEYHRSLIPNVPDEKILISANGVDMRNFDQEVKRNPKKVIYTSAPERGLEYILDIIPEVRKAVPDVEFALYYGFQNWRNGYAGDKNAMAWVDKLEKKIKDLGLNEYKRLSHREIAKEMLSSGVWFYPTDFPEISCIAAMKAQVAGAIPVCFNYAALNETVQYGSKIAGDPKNEKDLKQITSDLISFLKHPEKQDDIRKEMMPWARDKYTWTNVAKQWDSQWQG